MDLELPTYQTLPGAVGTVSGSRDVETESTSVTGSIEWSFGSSATLPEQPGSYEAKFFTNRVTALAAAEGGMDPVEKLTIDKCKDEDGDNATVRETGSGFGFSQDLVPLTRATDAQEDYTVTALVCVRAELKGTQRSSPATADGPWKVGTTTVSVKKQPSS